jgi:hypothetical protein
LQGLRADLDVVAKRNNPAHTENQNPVAGPQQLSKLQLIIIAIILI